MRVSSPIGELPFQPRALTYQDRTVVVDGQMGAWPARVVIEPGDLPAVLRLVAKPAAVAAAAAAVAALAITRRQH